MGDMYLYYFTCEPNLLTKYKYLFRKRKLTGTSHDSPTVRSVYCVLYMSEIVYKDIKQNSKSPTSGHIVYKIHINLINSAGVARTVLQTSSSIIHSFINYLTDAFPPNPQGTFTPQPFELRT